MDIGCGNFVACITYYAIMYVITLNMFIQNKDLARKW